MDNYYTSPLLFQCLLAKQQFCIGTVWKTKARLGGAYKTWALLNNEISYFRCEEIVFTRKMDSREVLLLSTATIFEPVFYIVFVAPFIYFFISLYASTQVYPLPIHPLIGFIRVRPLVSIPQTTKCVYSKHIPLKPMS